MFLLIHFILSRIPLKIRSFCHMNKIRQIKIYVNIFIWSFIWLSSITARLSSCRKRAGAVGYPTAGAGSMLRRGGLTHTSEACAQGDHCRRKTKYQRAKPKGQERHPKICKQRDDCERNQSRYRHSVYPRRHSGSGLDCRRGGDKGSCRDESHPFDDPLHGDDSSVVLRQVAKACDNPPCGKEMSNAPKVGHCSGDVEHDLVHRVPSKIISFSSLLTISMAPNGKFTGGGYYTG